MLTDFEKLYCWESFLLQFPLHLAPLILTADYALNLFRALFAAAVEPLFHHRVEAAFKKLQMVVDILVVKIPLGLPCVIVSYLESAVIAELKIGAVKKLVVAHMAEKAQIIAAIIVVRYFRRVKLRHLPLQMLAHLIREVVYVNKIRVKCTAVEAAALADIRNSDFIYFLCLQQFNEHPLYFFHRFAPAPVVLCIHALTSVIIPTPVERLMLVFAFRTYYTFFARKQQLLY